LNERGEERILSIQQDKRVIKPSKMSERYAQWFETRVLSTSPLFRYLVMFMLTFPISIFSAYLILHLVNPLSVHLLNLGIGMFLYLLYLGILQTRFQSQITDQQFSRIVESAQDRVLTWRRVSIWPRQSAEPYITSTFNALFDAVIVSDTMIDLIDKMPESGEALLAFHLLRAPKRRNFADFVAAISVFFISTSFFAYFIITLLAVSFYYPFALLYILYIPIYYFAPVILIIVVKSALWTHDSAFERTSSIYHIHPQVAKDEVTSSQKLDDETAKATIWVVREWERKKRDGRRSSITFLGIIGAFLLESLFLLNFGIPFSSPYFYVLSSSVYIVPFIAGIAVFLVLRRWDKKCMAESYYTTKAADEPIWVD
jgi:hypothetical protein